MLDGFVAVAAGARLPGRRRHNTVTIRAGRPVGLAFSATLLAAWHGAAALNLPYSNRDRRVPKHQRALAVSQVGAHL
ncbi:hypothetical protein [Mycobacterium arosiense]|uniref:hypothetical protein n=1 Tax=Mycobacterium arosiense TaxID=425468 RepID=UPI00114EBAF5|nr:hypothetical protein [Mycobacterium arosiense]